MKYLSYFVIVLGMGIQLTQAMEDGNDLTPQEEAALKEVRMRHLVIRPGLNDESVGLTQQMANEMPVSALEKIVRANEEAITETFRRPEEIARLEAELVILRAAIEHQNR